MRFARRQSGRENRTGTLDVTDDGTGSVVHELNANLGNTTARACVAKNRQQFVLQFVQSSMAVSESSRVSSSVCAVLLFPVDSFSAAGNGGLSSFLCVNVPVRPRTRVTLTSLTGTLADSILKSCVMS